jgi:hypothetical protein
MMSMRIGDAGDMDQWQPGYQGDALSGAGLVQPEAECSQSSHRDADMPRRLAGLASARLTPVSAELAAPYKSVYRQAAEVVNCLAWILRVPCEPRRSVIKEWGTRVDEPVPHPYSEPASQMRQGFADEHGVAAGDLRPARRPRRWPGRAGHRGCRRWPACVA